jgi:hypothetical protein
MAKAHFAFFITGLLAASLPTAQLTAQDVGTKAKLAFACSFGKKHVRVVADSLWLTYEFGPRNRPELKLTRETKDSEVGYNYSLFPRAEHRSFRISNGPYHYILFRRFSAPNYQGRYAEDVDGLMVFKGAKLLAKYQCKSGDGFDYGYDFEWLNKDKRDWAELAE